METLGEIFETLGYEKKDSEKICKLVKMFARKKSIISPSEVTIGEMAMIGLIYDILVKREAKGK